MGVSKFRGIIIKEFPVGESDKILTFFTKEHGKMSARAKGARKIKSKYMSGSHVFTYGDFVMFSGNNFNSITQIDVIEGFYDLCLDYDKFTFGSYMLEIIDKSTMENSPNEECLKLILKTFQNLCKKDTDLKHVLSTFIFKYLGLNGYVPETENCVICGGPLHEENMFFSIEGTVCGECENKSGHIIPISYTTLYGIKYIYDAEIKNLYHFKLSKDALDELFLCASLFLENLEINLKSKELLDELIK